MTENEWNFKKLRKFLYDTFVKTFNLHISHLYFENSYNKKFNS